MDVGEITLTESSSAKVRVIGQHTLKSNRPQYHASTATSKQNAEESHAKDIGQQRVA